MRTRPSDADRPIRLHVRSRTHRATYELPRTDRPVEMLCNLPAHMLDGATLYVDGATSLPPGAVSTVPVVTDEPTEKPTRRRAA